MFASDETNQANERLDGFLRLDASRLGHRTAEAFPAIYSTTVSIVQGVVLGYLASQALTDVKALQGFQLARVLAQTAIMLFAISVILYGYNWLGLVLRWRTGYADATVPVLLAVAEFIPIRFSGARDWPYSFAILGFMSGMAFLLSYLHARPGVFGDWSGVNNVECLSPSLLTKRSYRRFIATCLLTASGVAVLGFEYRRATDEMVRNWISAGSVVIAFAGVLILLLLMRAYLAAMYRCYLRAEVPESEVEARDRIGCSSAKIALVMTGIVAFGIGYAMTQRRRMK